MWYRIFVVLDAKNWDGPAECFFFFVCSYFSFVTKATWLGDLIFVTFRDDIASIKLLPRDLLLQLASLVFSVSLVMLSEYLEFIKNGRVLLCEYWLVMIYTVV